MSAIDRNFSKGHVIQKRGRDGNVMAEVIADGNGGFTFGGQYYKSLSGAALAVAQSLGLNPRSLNGYVYFGLGENVGAGRGRKVACAEPTLSAAQNVLRLSLKLKIHLGMVAETEQELAAAELVLKAEEEAAIKAEEEEAKGLEARLAEIKARKNGAVK